MGYKSIKDGLATVLEELVGTGQTFNVLHKNFEAQLVNFPALLFRMVDSDGETRMDSESNEIHARFIVRAVFTYENSESADDTLLEALDEVCEHLREIPTRDILRGAVHRMDIEKTTFFDSQDSTAPVYGFDIVLNLAKLEP